MKEFFNQILDILKNPVIANVLTTILLPLICVGIKLFSNGIKKSSSNDKTVEELKEKVKEMKTVIDEYQNVLNKNTALDMTIVELINTAFQNSKLDNDTKQRLSEIAVTAKNMITLSAPKVKEAIEKSVDAINEISDGVKQLKETIKQESYLDKLKKDEDTYLANLGDNSE